jgi:hypothetical protein
VEQDVDQLPDPLAGAVALALLTVDREHLKVVK